jgi:UDP-N-acetylglucosamine diphosphorylase / glucose-1-phosphate thymidylyltransferase / UDP-N-acetylgalactosamine diphosphorylase / glucosamine-1-phosphate N-acetyltransferase / galactosamine-1-phosphate N-acetyltransferase
MQTNITKAVLLAAGRGTRMRDLTEALPKPMLEVRGKPVLQHIVDGLRINGLTNLLVVVGWRAEIVKEFFGDGSKFGIKIQYETQTVQDGTGRVVALARDFVGPDPFLLSYGDILVAPESYQRICGLLADAEAVISVKRSDDVSQGGAVFVNDKFELVDLREKPKPGEPTSPWYNAGIYAFRASIFQFIAKLEPSPRGEYELTDAVRNLAFAGKKVQALEIAGDWADVRDPEILARLNADL